MSDKMKCLCIGFAAGIYFMLFVLMATSAIASPESDRCLKQLEQQSDLAETFDVKVVVEPTHTDILGNPIKPAERRLTTSGSNTLRGRAETTADKCMQILDEDER